MKLHFTKMHGAGNDFVVLDATREPLPLRAELMRRLGDRRFGVGADQILVVEPSTEPGVDFGYRIFNGGSGDEVEQCGNGARCFVRYVHDKGLSDKTTLRVKTMNTQLELRLQADGRVTVDMDRPIFDLARVPFDPTGLTPREVDGFALWPLALGDGTRVEAAVLSMGNPHAVLVVPQFGVADVDAAPVETAGRRIQQLACFPREVNVGFMQIVARDRIRLRVYERGVGETLACGTGASAAVVAGIRLGLLDSRVDVEARGGRLTIAWQGHDSTVLMTGPAETVFEGNIDL
ncbi:MAG TPA: diaminopimelate epimerase [Burkholderiaceae bacterium]|nr:diaminopimelate epimerase [Burkholderiaceae bacterium]